MTTRRILLFTKTTGYRHDSLEDGVALITSAAAADGIEVTRTEDAEDFTPQNLALFNAVVWLQVSGDVLGPSERDAFADYLRGGGGFAGIHGASDAEWSWPDYLDIVGARFLFHPGGELQLQSARVLVEGAEHPATVAIPAEWTWRDEWYAFTRNPRGSFSVLLRIDEDSYDPGEKPMGADHPVSWHGSFGAGRTWYTALGHDTASYGDPVFRTHLWGGIASVLR